MFTNITKNFVHGLKEKLGFVKPVIPEKVTVRYKGMDLTQGIVDEISLTNLRNEKERYKSFSKKSLYGYALGVVLGAQAVAFSYNTVAVKDPAVFMKKKMLFAAAACTLLLSSKVRKHTLDSAQEFDVIEYIKTGKLTDDMGKNTVVMAERSGLQIAPSAEEVEFTRRTKTRQLVYGRVG